MEHAPPYTSVCKMRQKNLTWKGGPLHVTNPAPGAHSVYKLYMGKRRNASVFWEGALRFMPPPEYCPLASTTCAQYLRHALRLQTVHGQTSRCTVSTNGAQCVHVQCLHIF